MTTGKRYGGHSMAAPLKRVMICTPAEAGWGEAPLAATWRELGYCHEPSADLAEQQHRRLRAHLEECGAEVIQLTPAGGLSTDTVYVRDPSMITDHGAVCLRMGKPQRAGEPERHRAFYESAGIPILGEIREPGTAEAGDMVWLNPRTLLVGRSYRTNAAGIEQLAGLLGPKGIDVIPAPLVHGGGPEVCRHLMSILSVPEERVAIVDIELMAVETVELLTRMEFTLLEIDPSERRTQAGNVLSLGNRRLVAIEENVRTNQRLRGHGFDVRTFPGSEVCQNGGGGPTCLTRPILRE